MAERNEKVNHRRREKKVVIIKKGSTVQDVVDAIETLEIDGGTAFNTGTAYIGIDGGSA